jgi:hypothetical protein
MSRTLSGERLSAHSIGLFAKPAGSAAVHFRRSDGASCAQGGCFAQLYPSRHVELQPKEIYGMHHLPGTEG